MAHIDDLSGDGARIYGGRWNEKGIPVIYASQSRALAALEYLVHLPLALAPPQLGVCTLSLPDDVSVTRLRKTLLPADWRTFPLPPAMMAIGAKWAQAGKTLLLAVPSVIIPDERNVLVNLGHPEFRKERNVLINPGHPELRKIRKRINPFSFDPRLAERN